MIAFRSLAVAMGKGFVRDRMALFFAVLFPLMFLVLFGGLFGDSGAPKSTIVQVGHVSLLDDAPPQARAAYDEYLDVEKSDDLEEARATVREGDADAVLTQKGSKLRLDFSAADQVKAGQLQGTMQSLVQNANVQATGEPPKFTLEAEQVEDESLSTIQYLTPGLLGWAIAMGATFGAAANLVVWRKNGMLRRLRLAPVPTRSIVLARVVVSLGVAALQTAIFVLVASTVFDLQISGTVWLSVPLLVLGTLSFMAIGLLAGSVSKTEEGATGLANFVILPMAFLSGSFFPLEAAPQWVRTVSEFLPLKHLATAMQDVLSRGEGWGAALPVMGGLLAFAAVMTLIASRLFRWDAA